MTRSVQEIQDWMIDRISRLTGHAAEQIDPGVPVLHHGLDSVAVVSFAADLEEWLGCKFRGNPFDEHATIEALAQFLAGQSTLAEQAEGGKKSMP